MPLRALIAGLILMLCAAMAQAGAWPREEGKGFFSTDVRLSWPQNLRHWTSPNPTEQYYTAYLEYGLSDRLTIGFDLGRSVSGDGKTIGFLQIPLRNTDTGPKVSAALGLGRIGEQTVLRPGLFIGWGMEKGWLTIDSMAEYQIENGLTDYKMDLTWGRNLARDRKLIVQVQTGKPAVDPAFVRLAPSIVFPMGKRSKIETGATWGLTGDSSVGLKFGLWTDF
ncbi:hypothetical protein [Tropicibacter oceani]|uniref:Transporter n=1 Tax=Tropicibacter oceani TaxID=3058420 RepID=A0ABY8QHG8_9RHOB|nr:hypothetical protein [Tropicibacter oceani]WGW04085.1 hypothetical protein QF118_00675 [Tropicibacter oceani]